MLVGHLPCITAMRNVQLFIRFLANKLQGGPVAAHIQIRFMVQVAPSPIRPSRNSSSGRDAEAPAHAHVSDGLRFRWLPTVLIQPCTGSKHGEK